MGLVKQSHSGTIVLPEFQRSFVWGNQDIKDLLVSVLNGYFVGTFLLLRRKDRFDFKIRYIEGVEKVNPDLPGEPNEAGVDKAVLDGQQRLTALFYVLYYPPGIAPKGTSYAHRYFIRVHEKLDGNDWDDVIWSVSENDRTRNIEVDLGDGRRKYCFKELIEKTGDFGKLLEESGFKKYCYENGIMPLCSLRNDDEFNRWLDDYVGHFINNGESYDEMTKKKESIRRLFIDWFGFNVPVLTLEGRPLYEVAEVFERINRTGVELSVFALATAVFFKKDMNLRSWWDEYYQKDDAGVTRFCKDDDEEYPKYILQIVALIDGKEVKKRVLINPREFSVDGGKWEGACERLNSALKRLKNSQTGYGVVRPDLLPYRPIIVSLAGILGECRSDSDFRKLDAWYWSSVFTGRYAGSSDTAIKQDFDQTKEWFSEPSAIPVVVKQAQDHIEDLNLRRVDRGALYKAILNIIALKGAKDFFTGQSIELVRLNDHHIFPRKSGIRLTDENSILNRTMISDETNRLILNKRPSQYLGDMQQRIADEQRIKDVLATHLIDEGSLTAMRADSYEDFLSAREQFMKNAMKKMIEA